MEKSNHITVRKSEDRGYANHGWLDSYHSFSFANYYDPKFTGWGCLRVINEDRVSAGEGFGTHPHKEFEIFSYVISGELSHTDSLKNNEVIHRGEVQFTSAGTGISHSEYNYHKSLPAYFLQIWVKPNVSGLKPSYQTMKFNDDDKLNHLLKIVGPHSSEESSKHKHILIHNNIDVYASLLENGKQVKHNFKGNKGYVHLTKDGGSITINGHQLNEGDGAFINNTQEPLLIQGNSKKTSEFLLFDLVD